MQISIIALAYYVAGKLSFSISNENHIVTIVIFASEGISLAMTLIYGKRIWLAVFIGQFLLAYSSTSLSTTIGIATINSLEVILAHELFYYFKLNRKLSTLKDVLGLIALITFILQPFSSIFGNMILFFTSVITMDELFNSLFSWWFGNTMGQILVTPMILLMYTHFKLEELTELISVILFFIVISYFFQVTIAIHNLSLLLSITLPLILYLSSHRGLHYATLATTIIASTSVYFTHLGIGSFVQGDFINNIINLNFYFLSQTLLVLIVGTLFSEKREYANQLEKLVEKEVEKNREKELLMMQQSRLAQMGQVLNMIAHQWRQPLNNLLLTIEVFLHKYRKKELNNELVEQFEKDSYLQIKQMSGTVDDFRDFFQPRREKSIFLVNDIIEHLLLIMQPIFSASNITLYFNEENEVYSKGYPNELAQALINILYNSKDALLEHNNHERVVTIELEEREEHAFLTIQDNAGGIPIEIIDKIFDPYFSTKLKEEGTGLGLYMSKIIIENHMGGEILVHNHQNGAIFTIILPLSKEG